MGAIFLLWALAMLFIMTKYTYINYQIRDRRMFYIGVGIQVLLILWAGVGIPYLYF